VKMELKRPLSFWFPGDGQSLSFLSSGGNSSSMLSAQSPLSGFFGLEYLDPDNVEDLNRIIDAPAPIAAIMSTHISQIGVRC
jgi:hypothetical protein